MIIGKKIQKVGIVHMSANKNQQIEEERKILEIVLQKSNKPRHYTGKRIYKLLAGNIMQSDKPDFIINTDNLKIGLEHFLISTVMRGENYPLNIWQINEYSNLYKSYTGNKDSINADIDSGVIPKKVENLVNEIVSIRNKFTYKDFIERFCNALGDEGNHVKHIDHYKKNCDILGFMVELPDISNGMYQLNGSSVSQQFAIMPFSNDMCNCIDSLFTKYKNLSFLIFVFDKNKVLYLSSKNWKNDLKIQNVHICKYFDIKKINRKLQLNVK